MSASDALVMSSEDGAPPHSVEVGQVKFTKDNESIDVRGEQKLIGLTKEQLERYRNDPLWKPIRYTLFALFWLVWIGMFAGAILIVIMSPRCAAKKEVEWHPKTVAYQVFTPTFRDSDGDGVGDFNGIKEKLNDLRRIGISSVWVTPLLSAVKENFFNLGEFLDFTKVDPRFGSEEDVRALIKRAHDLNLHFITDLPLTVFKDHPLAKEGVGTGDVRLLNIENPAAREAIKQTAARLIDFGVDGLYFALNGQRMPPAITAAKMDELANEIRRENAEKLYGGKQEAFVIITDSPITAAAPSINYYTRSLGKFPNTRTACQAADFLQCLAESAATGYNQIRANASSMPLWQLGDVSHARADSLFGNVGEAAANASVLATAIQLFLPGPVKIFYGEELGLVSLTNDSTPFGLMPWDNTGKYGGFTTLSERLIFKPLAPEVIEKLNFDAQFNAPHSPLKTFRKLAQLRTHDEVFLEGNLTHSKVSGLHVFARRLEGDEKAYVLVANWPLPNDRTPKQFVVDATLLPGAEIKAADWVLDFPYWHENPSQITVDSTKLTLKPYEWALIRVTVA
ncbi:Neutral and basic amino acid transport protein rBAT [Aphelenchoides fujianensis]|nr:Neutral and basic amino acid transport protein rBAT [Aphelenchoides fujianensis]